MERQVHGVLRGVNVSGGVVGSEGLVDVLMIAGLAKDTNLVIQVIVHVVLVISLHITREKLSE